MTTGTATVKPSGKMYGLLHDAEGRPVVREPRNLKIGIGLPKGKSLPIWIDAKLKWCVQVGQDVKRFDTKAEAKTFYREAKKNAPERKYPQRLPYFTFTRVSSDGSFDPDFDVIEQHGPTPTEIDIVFILDEPLKASYQMWTSTERKCEGDGINAMRVNSMAQSEPEKALAAQAVRNGEKYFPIVNGCWTRNCPYSKRQGNKDAACSPHGRLLFQLLNAPRLGGTAYYDTTGYRSISQIFSCIQIIKTWTGKGDAERGFVAGIPLKMVMAPYKVVTPDGRPTTQYAVRLEFRADSVVDLKKRLIEAGVEFRTADRGALKLLDGGAPAELPTDDVDEPPEIPAAIDAEFSSVGNGDEDPDGSDDAGAAPPPTAETPQLKSDVPGESISPEQQRSDEEWAAFFSQQQEAGSDATEGQPADTGQTVQSEAPKVEAPPDPAIKQSAEQDAATSPPPVTPPQKPKASKQDQDSFYLICRDRGLTDIQISQKLGTEGFETIDQVPADHIQALIKWAQELKSKKK